MEMRREGSRRGSGSGSGSGRGRGIIMGVMIMLMMTMMMTIVIGSTNKYVTAAPPNTYTETTYEPSWSEWFSTKLHRLNPFASKLGHDWQDTHNKVETIYQRSHDAAQRRVEELREDALTRADVRQRIAEIYAEEAARAENDIESMSHSMLDFLRDWKTKVATVATTASHSIPGLGTSGSGSGSGSSSSGSGVANAVGDAASKASDKARDLGHRVQEQIESLPKTLSHGYRNALEQAKTSVDQLGTQAGTSWEATKSKAAEAYSEAFHKGHGKTRTVLGKLRDAFGHGAHNAAHLAHEAACATWHLFLHGLTGALALCAGVFVTVTGMAWWNRRQFRNQLNANIHGPVALAGRYWVTGGEENHKKFFEYWTGPAALFFQRQPGNRKHWLQRGTPGASNVWMCYSEWASLDDLRRVMASNEFNTLMKRAPKPTLKDTYIFQLPASSRSMSEDGDGVSEGSGVRHRSGAGTSASSTTTSSTTH